jgi:hypothetical protein
MDFEMIPYLTGRAFDGVTVTPVPYAGTLLENGDVIPGTAKLRIDFKQVVRY